MESSSPNKDERWKSISLLNLKLEKIYTYSHSINIIEFTMNPVSISLFITDLENRVENSDVISEDCRSYEMLKGGVNISTTIRSNKVRVFSLKGNGNGRRKLLNWFKSKYGPTYNIVDYYLNCNNGVFTNRTKRCKYPKLDTSSFTTNSKTSDLVIKLNEVLDGK